MNQSAVFWIIGIAVTIAGLLLSAGLFVLGYFLNDLREKLSRLESKQDAHDAKDDQRFKDMESRMDRVKEDTVQRRHDLRSEMREAFAAAAESRERLEERLTSKIDAVRIELEAKIKQ